MYRLLAECASSAMAPEDIIQKQRIKLYIGLGVNEIHPLPWSEQQLLAGKLPFTYQPKGPRNDVK